MTYKQTLDYLYSSQPAFHLIGGAAYKPGLDNTIALMTHLGNPHRKFQSVHIAGTNGKGSCSHLIAAALQASGKRVGLYTSPHLVDFRERIRINGQMIEEKAVVDFVEKHHHFLEQVRPSFFETTMALAFDYFAREQVDIAVIEVGLGGRLDSTNIITPLLSVITNIGFDHTEYLGNTLAQIAAEKAGIIKPHIPVVIGESNNETKPVFIAKAMHEQAPILFADEQPLVLINCELHGIYQQHNIQTAYYALQQLGVSEPSISEGFAHVCQLTGLQGRWQVLQQSPLIICDTGHNSHGIRYVAEQLSDELAKRQQSVASCQLHIVFGMVSDKDVDVVMSLLPPNAVYYFTQAQTHRAIPAEKLREMFLTLHPAANVSSFPKLTSAIDQVMQHASASDIIFIGGSNYIVGEALTILSTH